MMFVGGQSGATKLHVTESEYNLQMKGKAHALRVNLSKNPSSILVDQNSKLHLSQATTGASAIVLGNGATLTMDNGTLITEGNFLKRYLFSGQQLHHYHSEWLPCGCKLYRGY